MKLRLLTLVRALTAVVLIGGMIAAGSRSVTAQDDESGVDGNTFTGPNFGWSVEWDEDVWTLDAEDNTGGSDFISLSTVDDPFVIARFFGIADFNGDPDTCIEGYGETLEGFDENSDVALSEDFDLPDSAEDGASATYTYTTAVDDGDVDIVEYVSCQVLVEDQAVLIFTITTTPNVFDDVVGTIDDLAAEIALPDDSGSADGDDQGADDNTDGDDGSDDATDDTSDDATDDSNDDAGSDDDADAEPTRDVLLGDGDDDDAADDTSDDNADATDDGASDDATDDGGSDDDTTGDATDDDDTAQADSGIDDTTYTSPTYGYSLEWDDRTWTVDASAELIDEGDVGLDRLLVRHEDEDGLYASLYIDGKSEYGADLTDCLDGEADLLAAEDGVEDFAPVEDRSGDPVAGESDGGGEYAVYVGSVESDSGDSANLNFYIECRTAVEDESVLVITLIAAESSFDDELDLATEIFDSIEIEGDAGATSDDDAPANDTAADDEAAGDDGADADDSSADDATDDDGGTDTEDDESARATLVSADAA